MKNNFSPEDFQTRANKAKKLEFPQSDESRVIVCANQEGIGFKFNCYKQEFLQAHIDKITFDQTVQAAHKICENVWKLRKKQESSDQQEGSVYFLMGALVLSIISFIMLIVVVYETQSMQLLYAAIAIIAMAGALPLYVAFRTLFVTPNFIDLESEIINRLTIFLEHENNTKYLEKGLKWEMQPKFYWLELQIANRK